MTDIPLLGQQDPASLGQSLQPQLGGHQVLAEGQQLHSEAGQLRVEVSNLVSCAGHLAGSGTID